MHTCEPTGIWHVATCSVHARGWPWRGCRAWQAQAPTSHSHSLQKRKVLD